MLKYCVGFDISQKSFDACLSVIDSEQRVKIVTTHKFSNNSAGFSQVDKWLQKHAKRKDIPLVIVMEATGVYFENCAMWLHKKGYSISVVLPTKSKKYLQATGLKSKNDNIDAKGLARMGAEQSLPAWEPVSEYFYQLRSLTRQYQSLQEHNTILKNQLHADQAGMYQNQLVITQLKTLIESIDEQIHLLGKAISKHIEADNDVASKVKNICQIKGVGVLTVATLIAETNGFSLFKNAPQLVSFSGYDVVENQSGSFKGKTRISKKGNSRIRRALYMPALSVVRYNEKPFLNLFERTLEKHHIKMKSYVAVQKKLLLIIYALWRKNEPFNSSYSKNLLSTELSLLP